MNKLQLSVYPAVVTLALLAAVSAHAQSTEGADYDFSSSGAKAVAAAPAPMQAPRQVVIVRGVRAVDVYADDYNPLAEAVSLKTRAEVRAEVLAGMQVVQHFAFVHGENIGPFFQASYAPNAALQPAPERLALAKTGR